MLGRDNYTKNNIDVTGNLVKAGCVKSEAKKEVEVILETRIIKREEFRSELSDLVNGYLELNGKISVINLRGIDEKVYLSSLTEMVRKGLKPLTNKYKDRLCYIMINMLKVEYEILGGDFINKIFKTSSKDIESYEKNIRRVLNLIIGVLKGEPEFIERFYSELGDLGDVITSDYILSKVYKSPFRALDNIESVERFAKLLKKEDIEILKKKVYEQLNIDATRDKTIDSKSKVKIKNYYKEVEDSLSLIKIKERDDINEIKHSLDVEKVIKEACLFIKDYELQQIADVLGINSSYAVLKDLVVNLFQICRQYDFDEELRTRLNKIRISKERHIDNKEVLIKIYNLVQFKLEKVYPK